MTEAVIFDVDGTLIDSVDLHAKAWVDAFHNYGHEAGFGEVRKQIGKGGDQLMPVFLSEDELEAKGGDLEEHRGKILKKRYLPQITAFPQVRELLRRLQADGKQIALASSAKQDELAKYKQVAQIEDVIDEETLSDDAESSKPDPGIFQAAMKRLGGKSPEQVMVVGDTPYDAEAAAKAGLHTIGLLCGGWPEDELKQAGCIAVYRDPADLLAHYAGSPLAGGEADRTHEEAGMAQALKHLADARVSVWLDDLGRSRIQTGSLARIVEQGDIVGITTNPTIFAKAIGAGSGYEDQLRDLALRGTAIGETLRLLTAWDVRAACDILRPVYDRTGGRDGRVSIEVDRRLGEIMGKGGDAAGTAERLASFAKSWDELIASVTVQMEKSGGTVMPAGAVKPASGDGGQDAAPAAGAPQPSGTKVPA